MRKSIIAIAILVLVVMIMHSRKNMDYIIPLGCMQSTMIVSYYTVTHNPNHLASSHVDTIAHAIIIILLLLYKCVSLANSINHRVIIIIIIIIIV